MKLLYTDAYDFRKTIHEDTDAIYVKGGDGTLLTAINKFAHLGLPFFGIAGGTLNFLMNNRVGPVDGGILPDATHFEVQTMDINVTSNRQDIGGGNFVSLVSTYNAFNDIVLGNFNVFTEFTCTHEDDQLGTFKGCGVVVSTAQGSTGINRNNNGTILPLSSPNWSVTGMQTNRTVNSVIAPTELVIDCKGRKTTRIGIDGSNHELDDVSSIKITPGKPVTIIINDVDGFNKRRQ